MQNGEDKNFIIENGVLKKYIGKRKDVIIPNGVKEIGIEAFRNAEISSIKFNEDIEKIGFNAFLDIRGGSEIDLIFPKNLKYIER